MIATEGKTHYEILGVDPQATIPEIRAAYRKKTAQYHPDKNPNLSEADKAEWKLITEVAPVIMKQSSREEYDDQLEAQRITAEAAEDTFDSSVDDSVANVDDDEFEQMVEDAADPAPMSTPTSRPTRPARPGQPSRRPAANNGPIPGYDPADIDPLTLVKTGRLEWMKHEIDGVKERFVTRHPGAKQESMFGAALILMPLLVIGMVLLSSMTASLLATILPIVGVLASIVFWIRWAAFLSDKVPFFVASAATIGTLGYAGFFAEEKMSPMLAIYCAVLSGLGIWLGIRTHYWRSYRVFIQDNLGARKFLKNDLKEGRVWGTVGQLTGGNFGDDATAKGVLGEENTAEVLRYLLNIPGTRIFHCLRFPTGPNGNTQADVDHAVVNGNKIALIDSKMWMGEKFSWDNSEHTAIRRTAHNGRIRRRETHFPKAVRDLSSRAFISADVRGWMVFYSSDGAKVMVDNAASTQTRLVTPHRMIEEIGTWFIEDDSNPGQVDPKLGTVDRTLMRTVLNQVKG